MRGELNSIAVIMFFGFVFSTALLVLCFMIYWREGGAKFEVADFWSVLGVAVSGVGLLLSAFAAYGVFALSKQHHIKGRLRDFATDLPKFMAELTTCADQSIMYLRKSGVIGRIKPTMASVARIDSRHFSAAIEAVSKAQSAFENACASGKEDGNVRDYREFWKLHEELTAVVDAVGHYRKDREI